MALDSHIYTIVEPKIKLDSMKVPNLGERESGDKSSSFQGGITPYIKINNYNMNISIKLSDNTIINFKN